MCSSTRTEYSFRPTGFVGNKNWRRLFSIWKVVLPQPRGRILFVSAISIGRSQLVGNRTTVAILHLYFQGTRQSL